MAIFKNILSQLLLIKEHIITVNTQCLLWKAKNIVTFYYITIKCIKKQKTIMINSYKL